MRRRLHLVGLALVAALAVASGPAAGADPSGGANNVVIAQTTADGAWLARSSTMAVSVAGDTVTSANIATATTSDCSACHSTAVAVQVLLVTGTPSYFAPANVAAATNAACAGCGAYAYAWQYVLQTPGPAHLSPDAQVQLTVLRAEINVTAGSTLPSDGLTDPCFTPDGPPYPCETRDERLTASLDELTSQLKAVVDSGITGPATGSVTRDAHGD
jgi:hypothetical protein